MRERNGPSLCGRILLALLTLYALAMLAPDFVRLAGLWAPSAWRRTPTG